MTFFVNFPSSIVPLENAILSHSYFVKCVYFCEEENISSQKNDNYYFTLQTARFITKFYHAELSVTGVLALIDGMFDFDL